jgi:hypothetical protein
MTLESSIAILQKYIVQNKYRGYDPYDALKSPVFKWPFLNSSRLIRFGTQQLVKRSPFNFRPLLSIPKGLNPVTLGLCIQAYSYLFTLDPNNEKLLKEINRLITLLERYVPKGFSGSCWGYDFDWQARYASIDAFQPTVVATGIITNGLFTSYKLTNNDKAKELALSASNFVLNDLNRTKNENGTCFSYSPFDEQQVLNASMKGARILAQAYYLSGNYELLEVAKEAVRFTISHQNDTGSWPYSLVRTGGWVDNYHTGYVLDCLNDYQTISGDKTFINNIDKGYQFYKSSFIEKNGRPKFYFNNKYPLDCTSGAQSILTLVKFGDINTARKVAEYMIDEMQKPSGSFRFRAFKNYTISTSFMRWSDAWMFVSLSYLLYSINTSA